jgi:hypothetical protein
MTVTVEKAQESVVDMRLEFPACRIVSLHSQSDHEVISLKTFRHREKLFGSVLIVTGQREYQLFVA